VLFRSGVTTDTQDAFGKVTRREEPGDLSAEDIATVLDKFHGRVQQVPPMVSAVRYRGRKLYELARQGQEVPREPRWVEIHEVKLRRWEPPRAVFDVCCSKGTYIRTLIADLGKRLGCGAYMSFLLRTKAGIFELSSSLTLEELNSADQQGMLEQVLVPVDVALAKLPFVIVQPGAVKSVCSGSKLYPAGVFNLPSGLYEDQLIRLQAATVKNGCATRLLAIARVGVEKGITGKRFVFYPVCVFGDS